jgi:hypothetical protein
MRHTVGKLSTRATTLLQTSSQSEVCTQSYGAPKSRESQPWRFWDSHLGILGQKVIWMWAPGEGGGFPQVRAVVSLVCLCCPWLILAPKMFQLRTNHLMWVLCRPMWVSEACQLFLVPSRSSSTPLYPSKVLWAKEHAPTPYSSVVFYLGLTFEFLKELGVCQTLRTFITHQHMGCSTSKPTQHTP